MVRVASHFGLWAASVVVSVAAATGALAQTAPAHPDPCATPRSAVSGLLYWQQPEHRDGQKAAACLDLSQTSDGRTAADIAKQIKAVLDARGLVVRADAVPADTDYRNHAGIPRYHPFRQLPSLYLEQVEGRWLWSAATVRAIDDLHRSTFLVDIETWTATLPGWLQQSAVGVAVWQLIGLFMVLLLALVCRTLVMVVSASQARAFMIRVGARWGAEVLSHVDRPLGGLAAAGVAALLLPALHLPVRLTYVGLLAARVLAAFSAMWALVRLVDLLAAWLEARAAETETKLDDQLVPLIRRALKIFTVAVGAIFVLQNLNVDVAGLVAGLGLGGLAFALAAKETVSNVFGSATIFADRPFHIGDWVVIGKAEGIVESVGFRSTKVRTFYNSVVSVPNSAVASEVIDNLGARVYRRCRTVLGIRYDTRPEQIQAFVDGIRAIIQANPHTRKDAYEVHFNDFGASSLQILVYFFFKVPSWSEELKQRHNVLLEIVRLAEALGVGFAFPTQSLHVETTAVPSSCAQPRKLSHEELAAVVARFAPGGQSSQPAGPQITSGYFAS